MSWALVFPPLTSYHRFLIHQLVQENFPSLVSFSIGKNDSRQIVIFWREDGQCMSENHDGDKKKKTSSMETAHSRPRARRPDMQLYVPRAMRRDSLDTNSASSDKALCIDGPDETIGEPRNVDATDNKKARSKKSAIASEVSNNNVGDNPSKKRMPRTLPKNANSEGATQQLNDSFVNEVDVQKSRKDEKVKRGTKKAKQNIKAAVNADVSGNEELGVLQMGSGDHVQSSLISETGVSAKALCAADVSCTESVLISADHNPLRETSRPTSIPEGDLECSVIATIEQQRNLDADATAAKSIASKCNSECEEDMPDTDYPNETLHDVSLEPVPLTFVLDLPVGECSPPVLDMPSHTKLTFPKSSKECSIPVSNLNAGGDALYVPASLNLDQVDEKLTDQVRLLSSCNISELTKLGCENIELFLKESAGLIAELENTNLINETSSTTHCVSVSHSTEETVGRHVCQPQAIDMNISLSPNDIYSSSVGSVISDMSNCKVSLPRKDIVATCDRTTEMGPLLQGVDAFVDVNDPKDVTGCNPSLSASESINADAHDSVIKNADNHVGCTCAAATNPNLTNNNCFMCALQRKIPNEITLMETNNNVDIPECKSVVPLGETVNVSDKLNNGGVTVKIKSGPPLQNAKDIKRVDKVAKSSQAVSPLPSTECGQTHVRHVDGESDFPNTGKHCQSKSCQTIDDSIFSTSVSGLSVDDTLNCVPSLVAPKDTFRCNDVCVQECQILPPQGADGEDQKLSDTTTEEICTTMKGIGASDAAVNDSDVSLDNGDDSWEAMYDEAGECLNPELMKELAVTVGKKIKVRRPKIDYTKFQPKEPQISDNEFSHVIEIYDFPVEFKTQDLMAGFAQFHNRGFDIKWVDDTHALGLFASPMAATDALNAFNPMFKTRPLSQATRDSKVKAKRCAEFLQPYRPRPETSASLARRLVSGALGLQVRIPKEQRELERQKLKEAKEKRKLAAKQKVDVWEGVVAASPP